jgi:transcriptional regulator with XRE-family HTH domain
MSIGATVKRIREAAGMSQQQLAGAAGISLSLLAQMEQGKNENPRLDTIRSLARALAVGVADLVGNGGEQTPPATAAKPKRKSGK